MSLKLRKAGKRIGGFRWGIVSLTEELQDIKVLLKEISKFEKIKEKKTGTFYLKSKGFLHFHSKENKRWADIRVGQNWGEPVDIKFNPSALDKKKFMAEVKKRYDSSLHA